MTERSRRQRPLADLTFSVLGAGRVGSSLASWAVALGAEAIAVAGRRGSEAARELAGRLDCVPVASERLTTAGQDLLILAVPDPELAGVAESLAGRQQAAVVVHTAGRHDASVLRPLTVRGSAVGSLHPLKAFPRPLLDPADAAGTVFGIDGAPEARELAGRLAHAFGGRPVAVPPEARLLYHFAATLAAGGVVTLLAAAAELADRGGLSREVLSGYLELARGALEAAAGGADPAAAITGPVARGDVQTVLAELQAVEAVSPELVPLAVQLARESLRQLARYAGTPSPGAHELDRELAAITPALWKVS